METTRPPLSRLALPWLGAALALLLAIGSGILLAELLMSPTLGELWDLGAYLTLTGAGTMAAGWIALRAADRAVSISLRTKAVLGGLIAAGVALLNVLITAQLMFISTEHDLKLLFAVLLFSAIITSFFTLWVASSVTGRIELIASAVRSLAAGDLQAHVEVTGGDEVARLAQDVDLLALRLRQADEQRRALDAERRELTTAISHDLRTPLAGLRAMTEALEDGVVEGDEVTRYYATMRREIDRLSRMIDDLFELARIDSRALRVNRQRVNVQEIAADVVDALQIGARSQAVDLTLTNAESWSAQLDGALVERALANLVRNALEHTPPGGRVDVTVAAQNGWVDFRVTDTGEGINADDLPRVWDRFYRAEKSRRPRANPDGAGLGLAIVRGIAEAHGGAVSAESAPGRGATFTIRLPRA